jgi:hypothetical protein
VLLIWNALARRPADKAALAALRAALAEPEHIHTCGPDCQKPLCVNRRREIAAAVEAEREACAKVCETGVDTEHPIVKGHIMRNFGGSKFLAQAIRARGCQK